MLSSERVASPRVEARRKELKEKETEIDMKNAYKNKKETWLFVSVVVGASIEDTEQSHETSQRGELRAEIEPRVAEPHDTGRYALGQGRLHLPSEKSRR